VDHNDEPLVLAGFGDAVTAAFGLRERFRRAHGVALLDADGTVVDFTVFTARQHSIECALRWADCSVEYGPPVRQAILYSAVRKSVAGPLREGDVEVLRAARARLAGAGVLVVDWLQCDGSNVRSIDFAADGDGWRQAASIA
jgi:hypothetical protein